VAAVATILGLLLFVTVLANYLSTQLPAQMRVNDANHALTVENQLSRWDASLRAAAAVGAVGGVLTQPVTLGSAGAPPFAAADGSSVGTESPGAGVAWSFTVVGTGVTIPQSTSGMVGASFVVHLRNSYTPPADVAFDQGAVVYAQTNGLPLLLVAPSINYTAGTLTVWIPEFQGSVGSEVGTGVAELSARLTSVETLSLPADGYHLASGSSTVLTIVTPYAAAWMDYFASSSSLAGFATCAPASSVACVGPFGFNGPVGTITFSVPATGLVMDIATYAVTLS
jgi:hypothetical protein